MTVSTEPDYAELAWTGVETLFSPGIKALDVAHIVVTYRDANNAITTLTAGVHLTVTRNTSTGIISAVPVALPTAPGTVIFRRVTPAVQAVDFANLGGYQPAVHTALHDAAAMRSAEDRTSIAQLIANGFVLPQALDAAASPTFRTVVLAALATAGLLAAGVGGTVRAATIADISFAAQPSGLATLDSGGRLPQTQTRLTPAFTSVAIGGATIGSSALAVTGLATFNTNGIVLTNTSSTSDFPIKQLNDSGGQTGAGALAIYGGGGGSGFITHNMRPVNANDTDGGWYQVDNTNYSSCLEMGQGGVQLTLTPAGAANPIATEKTVFVAQFVTAAPVLIWKAQTRFWQDPLNGSILVWYASNGSTLYGDIGSTGHMGLGIDASATYWLKIKGQSDTQLLLDANSGQRYTSQYWANNGTTKALAVWDQTNSIQIVGTQAVGATLGLSGGSTGDGADFQILPTHNIVIATSSGVSFNNRAQWSSPADGILLFQNFAGDNFTRLQLGGTTSSFPAIKRSSAVLAFRLADDSADCAITAAAGTFTGAVSVTGASLGTTGNFSAAAWTTSGVRQKLAAASYTDTSSSGTVAAAYTDLHGASTILASAATTFTQYYGAYFKAPIASTNVTFTNKSALGADTLAIAGAAQGTDVISTLGSSRFKSSDGSDVKHTFDVVSGGRYSGIFFANNGTAKAQFFHDNTNNVVAFTSLTASAHLVFAGGASGSNLVAINDVGFVKTNSGGVFGFVPNASDATGAPDTGFSRISAGLAALGTGAAASFAGSLKLTDLYTNNATYLHRTNTSLSDSAAAQSATMTNAPTAGNPTKWISIDDNGTRRIIPTWT